MDSGKLPLSIFLDLSKAFDILDHSILLNKLNFYGISNTPLKWFQNYLWGRQQFVEFEGTCSDTTFINTGVPQGSILGPLLFLIYMNDIHMASEKFDMILYADDTNLISPLCSFNSSFSCDKNDVNHMSEQINTELRNIQEWSNINKLSLNVSKTKYMIFHHHQRNIKTITPTLKINCEPVERVTEFNFLGLTIDENLSWKPHIQKLEIVDQWSTRIPPPPRRGWHCSKSQCNHFESDIADNHWASTYSHKGHAHEIWNWNSKANLSYAVETMPPRNRKIWYGHRAAI